MWIKICGITETATAERVAVLAPDAIGLNFYPKSPRHVSRDTARKIAINLPETIQAVGVFVNAEIAAIAETVADCRLTMVQLHGDEPPEFLARLRNAIPGVLLLRAWRMGTNLADLEAYLAECGRLEVSLAGCLIDAKVAGSYGGTGHTPSWTVLRSDYLRDDWPPLILAGGLTADNVADGIRTIQPWGVDVASGVESSPGVKDLERVGRFIAAARKAGL